MAGARIVLFGATGYTGELTARALVERGAAPLLAGRDAGRLARLAAKLGGLDSAVADAARPASLRALVGPGDVLVATAGPFARFGAVAVDAAIERGATYLDCAAEPAFIRTLFEDFGARAERAGVALLPAIGYEAVPGNLAGALALRQAGDAASAVEVGYFATGAFRTSGGTRASFAPAALAPGFAFRAGRIVSERGARRARGFAVDGSPRRAISAALPEHFTLPRIAPGLRDVDTYLGWAGRASRPLQAASLVGAAITRVPGARATLTALASRFVKGSSGGPDSERRARSGSYVMAIARDGAGRSLAEVALAGIDGYELTANLLAWAALRAADGTIRGTGVLGPVEAFGLDELEAACAAAGISRPSGT